MGAMAELETERHRQFTPPFLTNYCMVTFEGVIIHNSVVDLDSQSGSGSKKAKIIQKYSKQSINLKVLNVLF